MRKRLILEVIGAALLGFAAGCCGAWGHARPCPRMPRADLIFDAFPISGARENVRADWPQTVANDHPFEDIRYREVLINQQGRFGAEEDRPYRRFESVRQGRIHR